jgi:hypothetical protein
MAGTNSDRDPVVDALGAPPALDAGDWTRARDELARRAMAAGLVDVAFERHDSPLGWILVGATGEGLVRVGLPAARGDRARRSRDGRGRRGEHGRDDRLWQLQGGGAGAAGEARLDG